MGAKVTFPSLKSLVDRSGTWSNDGISRDRLEITNPRHTINTRSVQDSLIFREQAEMLALQNQQLESQLAWSQAQERRAKEECIQLVAQLQTQADATRRLQDRLKDEEDRREVSEERLRLMQRTSYESYRQR
jgi:hypothetical protein